MSRRRRPKSGAPGTTPGSAAAPAAAGQQAARAQQRRWYKVDLHAHTPASADYEEPNITYLDWLRTAADKGLDIVAVTDHNTVAGVDVYDEFQGEVQKAGAGTLRRTITFKGQPQGNLYYRAAAGSKIELAQDGSFKVNDALHVRLEAAQKPVTRKTESGQELLVPITLANGEAKIVQEYAW